MVQDSTTLQVWGLDYVLPEPHNVNYIFHILDVPQESCL